MKFFIRKEKRLVGKERNQVRKIINNFLRNKGQKTIKRIAFDEKGQGKIPNLYLSYAHSQESVVVILSFKGPVGIDVEPIERQKKLKPRVWLVAFSQDELLEIDDKNCLFWWTLKEAALKMKGWGFSRSEPSSYKIEKIKNKFELTNRNKLVIGGNWKSWERDGERITICY